MKKFEGTSEGKIKIVLLNAGPSMPAGSISYWDKYIHLSEYFSGYIISSVASQKHMKVSSMAKGFHFCPFLYYRGNSVIRNLLSYINFIRIALRIYYFSEKYDLIVAPNPFITAFTALTLRYLTGAKVIVEFNGNFDLAFKYEKANSRRLSDRIKEKVSGLVIPFILKRADMIKLLYEDQIKGFNLGKKSIKHCTSFADFVPITRFLNAKITDGKYILLLGYPWFLKGVDILIQAFNVISIKFPTHKLKVVGWCPVGKEYFIQLAEGNPNIELCDPVYYDEVVGLMANCTIYVLASRTESMGRVLIEAMACKKPIVASRVGGVPYIIKNRYNGLLFESENCQDLAMKISELLTDINLRKKLSENGRQHAIKLFSEKCYAQNYKKMAEELLR